MAQVLDGKWVRDQIFAEWKDRAAALGREKRPPGLAVVLVGHDPASEIYVRNKIKACEEMGMYSEKHTPPDSVRRKNCSTLVQSLNSARRNRRHSGADAAAAASGFPPDSGRDPIPTRMSTAFIR